MRYSYLVVEGPHDVEFIGRILRLNGLRKVRLLDKLYPLWAPVIPKTFPYRGDLLRRMPVPVFFQNDSHSVAIQNAGGVDNLVPTVEETLRVPGFRAGEIASIGMFLDADWKVSVPETFTRLKADCQGIGLQIADQPGVVFGSTRRAGMYILPNNQEPGTLENLLDECAARIYQDLRVAAQQFTAAAAITPLTSDDRAEFARPAGEIKATVGCIGNFLKPTRAIQNSIEDNRWLCAETLALPNISKLHEFLRSLIGF